MKPFRPRKAVVLSIVFSTVVGFFANIPTPAQNNLDVCRVTTSTWGTKEPRTGTGIHEIGKFPVNDFDGTAKSFSYSSGRKDFTIKAAIKYGDFRAVERRKPTEIMLSLLVSETSAETHETYIEAVEAGTTYGRKWGTVFVRNEISKGDVAYKFTLTCSDGISKSGVQRGETNTVRRQTKH